jgi:hypothetical protein
MKKNHHYIPLLTNFLLCQESNPRCYTLRTNTPLLGNTPVLCQILQLCPLIKKVYYKFSPSSRKCVGIISFCSDSCYFCLVVLHSLDKCGQWMKSQFLIWDYFSETKYLLTYDDREGKISNDTYRLSAFFSSPATKIFQRVLRILSLIFTTALLLE